MTPDHTTSYRDSLPAYSRLTRFTNILMSFRGYYGGLHFSVSVFSARLKNQNLFYSTQVVVVKTTFYSTVFEHENIMENNILYDIEMGVPDARNSLSLNESVPRFTNYCPQLCCILYLCLVSNIYVPNPMSQHSTGNNYVTKEKFSLTMFRCTIKVFYILHY